MLALFASAFGIGLIFNAAPGPVFAETIRRGLRGGYGAGLRVQFGSLIGDASWALLGLMGIGLLVQQDYLRVPIGIAGALYLAWLGVGAWRDAHREFEIGEEPSELASHGAFGSGALLSVTNPQNIAYWAALGSAMGAVGLKAPTLGDYGVFFGGFMAASVLWCFVCAGLVEMFRRKAGARWARATYRLCAIAFFALALAALRDVWREWPAHRAAPQADERVVVPRVVRGVCFVDSRCDVNG